MRGCSEASGGILGVLGGVIFVEMWILICVHAGGYGIDGIMGLGGDALGVFPAAMVWGSAGCAALSRPTALIQLKFGPLDQVLRQRIAATDAETLLRWSERVLTAQTLDEVLAD
jgi:hypothetical protein